GGSTFVTALYTSPRFATIRSTLPFVALGAVVLSALVLVGTTIQKTPLHSLIDGILLTPIHHPQFYEVPLTSPSSLLCASRFSWESSSGCICIAARCEEVWPGSILSVSLWACASSQHLCSGAAALYCPPSFAFHSSCC